MARNFVRASSQRLTTSDVPVTSTPLTMAGWMRSADAGANQTAICISASGGLLFWGLFVRGDLGGDPIRASSIGLEGGGGGANTTTGYTANQWHHIAGVYGSVTSRDAYIDGGSKGSNTSLATPITLDITALAAFPTGGSVSNHLDGDLAEWGIWDVALTDAEIAVLATGISPLGMRPDHLLRYYPLVSGASPEIERKAGFGLTLVNTPTVSVHPRIYYPSMPLLPEDFVGAAPGVGRIWRLAGVGGGLVGQRGSLVGHA